MVWGVSETKMWLVVLSNRKHINDLRRVVPVTWDSKYSRVVSIEATDERAAEIRGLPYILSVTEPQMGTAFAS